MTSDTAAAVQGDLKDTRILELGGIVDLLTVTGCEAHVWLGATRHNLAAEVADPTARTVRIYLGETVTDWLPSIPGKGQWQVEVECTFADGSVHTFPTTAPPILEVRAQGDPP